MIQARSLLVSLSDAELGALVRTQLDEDLARRLMLVALNATLEAPRERPTEKLRRANAAKPHAPRKAKPQTGGGAPVRDALPPGRQRRSPGEFEELVLQAIVGADDPVGVKELADARGWNRAMTNCALTRLVNLKKVFKAKSGSIVRYAVTQKAANDAVHAAIDGAGT